MVFKGPPRLELPEQGVPVQDKCLQGIRVITVAGQYRLRFRFDRRRGQTGNVAVLLGLEGAQEEVLLPRGQLQSLVLARVARPQSPDQEGVSLPVWTECPSVKWQIPTCVICRLGNRLVRVSDFSL